MVPIVISEERGVRYLHFGSELVQGAMRIARPDALVLEYTRWMMLPLLLRADSPWPASVLQVGLGSASITRFLLRHRPRARLTVVELSPTVVVAAHQYFKLPDASSRLTLEVADGHDYLAEGDARFDFIVVDGFDERGRAGMLDSTPFYLNCRRRLGARGMVAVNLIDRGRGVGATIARIEDAFEGRVLMLPRPEGGNHVAIAAVGRPIRTTAATLTATAARLKADTGLDLEPVVARLALRDPDPICL